MQYQKKSNSLTPWPRNNHDWVHAVTWWHATQLFQYKYSISILTVIMQHSSEYWVSTKKQTFQNRPSITAVYSWAGKVKQVHVLYLLWTITSGRPGYFIFTFQSITLSGSCTISTSKCNSWEIVPIHCSASNEQWFVSMETIIIYVPFNSNKGLVYTCGPYLIPVYLDTGHWTVVILCTKFWMDLQSSVW